MDTLQELAEYEALRRLKARYFFLMDTKQWDDWLALFLPEATLSYDLAVSTRGADGRTVRHVGLDDITENVMKANLDKTSSVHQGHTPILELVSEDEATGIWAMEDLVVGPHRPMTHGFGHYHDTYRKVDGSWRIASLHLKRLRLESVQVWPSDVQAWPPPPTES